MFSYADIRRAEISLILGRWYPFEFMEGELDEWHTVGDIVQSVMRRSPPAMLESMVLNRIQRIIRDGWLIPIEQVTLEAKLFKDGLMLDSRASQYQWNGPSS